MEQNSFGVIRLGLIKNYLKMKIILYFFLSLGLLQDVSFIDKILNDFKSNSKYLSLNIKSYDFTGSAIIENDDLYTYFQIKKKGTKEDYKLYVKDILNKKTYIDLGDESIKKLGFIKVKESKKIKCKLKKGLDKFVKIYFNEDLTEKGITNEEEKAFLIKILFDNMRSCYIDDETGLLILNKK